MPTDKGYRVFVDHLAEIRPLSPAQRAAIAAFLADPHDLDDLLARTVRLLTQLTGQVALVQYPSFARARVTHVELVPLGDRRMLVIVVTDTGRVSQRLAGVPVDLDEEEVAILRTRLAALVTGRPVGEGSERIRALSADAAEPGDRLASSLTSLAEVIGEELRSSARTAS